jgi:hypothetical protein
LKDNSDTPKSLILLYSDHEFDCVNGFHHELRKSA